MVISSSEVVAKASLVNLYPLSMSDLNYLGENYVIFSTTPKNFLSN